MCGQDARTTAGKMPALLHPWRNTFPSKITPDNELMVEH